MCLHHVVFLHQVFLAFPVLTGGGEEGCVVGVGAGRGKKMWEGVQWRRGGRGGGREGGWGG